MYTYRKNEWGEHWTVFSPSGWPLSEHATEREAKASAHMLNIIAGLAPEIEKEDESG